MAEIILVCGATGKTGSACARALVAAGGPRVRVLARDPAKAAALSALANVEVFQGDFGDKDSLKGAMAGVSKVFLCCANVPDQTAHECNVVDAAKEAQVKYLVKVSTCVELVYPSSPAAYGGWHHAIQRHLDNSGLKYTILYPTYFMDNMLGFFAGVKAGAPVATSFRPEDLVSMVSTEDVGKMGAALLLLPDTDTRTRHSSYKATGPAAVALPAVAGYIGDVAGKPVEYKNLTLDEEGAMMRQFGIPEEVCAALRVIFETCRTQSYVTGDFEYVTGAKGETVQEFLARNKAVFA